MSIRPSGAELFHADGQNDSTKGQTGERTDGHTQRNQQSLFAILRTGLFKRVCCPLIHGGLLCILPSRLSHKYPRNFVNKLPINTKSYPRRQIYIHLVLKQCSRFLLRTIASSNPGLERHIILNANFCGFPLCPLVTTVMALQGTQRPSPFTPALVEETVVLRFKAMIQKGHQTHQ